jgi:hypothetical protein
MQDSFSSRQTRQLFWDKSEEDDCFFEFDDNSSSPNTSMGQTTTTTTTAATLAREGERLPLLLGSHPNNENSLPNEDPLAPAEISSFASLPSTANSRSSLELSESSILLESPVRFYFCFYACALFLTFCAVNTILSHIFSSCISFHLLD